MILSIDPGYTSGSIVADQVVSADEFNVVGAIAINWSMRFDFFSTFFNANASKLSAIVIERYKLSNDPVKQRQQAGSEIPSARVIGVVETFAHLYNVYHLITFQEPYDRLQVRVLDQHKSKVGLIKHNQDAYRHLRYYLKFNARKVPLL